MITENLINHPGICTIGWTLLHFIWQGAIISLALTGVLAIARKASSQTRYFFSCLALALLVCAPIVTFGILISKEILPHTSPTTSAATIQHDWNIESGYTIALPPASSIHSQAAPSITTAESPPSHHTQISIETLLPWIVMLWLAGVLFMSIRLLGGLGRVSRLIQNGKSATGSITQQMDVLAQHLGLTRKVRLFQSDDVAVPTVAGLRYPVILLPVSLLTGFSAEYLEMILAHELAHVRRHDYLINLLQSAAEAILFYHPAVWWVSSRIRFERENCCDDMAAELTGDAVRYANALTALEEWRGANAQSAMLAANGGSLIRRVERLLGIAPRNTISPANWIAGIGLIALFAMGGLFLQASRADGDIPSTNTKITVEDDIQSQRRVRLVIGNEKMTYEGEVVSWETLREKLENIDNRENVIFEVAIAANEKSIKQHHEERMRAALLADELGFQYLSDIGVQPMGSKGGDKRGLETTDSLDANFDWKNIERMMQQFNHQMEKLQEGEAAAKALESLEEISRTMPQEIERLKQSLTRMKRDLEESEVIREEARRAADAANKAAKEAMRIASDAFDNKEIDRPTLDAEENISDKTITLDVKNMPIIELIRMLAAEGEINVIFREEDLDGHVTINVKDVPLEEVLTSALRTCGLTWIMEPGGIVRIIPIEDVGGVYNQPQRLRSSSNVKDRDVIKSDGVVIADNLSVIEAETALDILKADGYLATVEEKDGKCAVLMNVNSNDETISECKRLLENLHNDGYYKAKEK